MRKSLFARVKGISVVRVHGLHINRLINLCARQKLNVICTEKTGDSCLFTIASKDWKSLCEYITKLRMEYEIERETGIPFWFRQYKKRLWLPVCFLLLVFCIWLFSRYVWNITVTGTDRYTEEQIKAYVTSECVTVGTKKSEVDCAAIELKLREHYSDIAWISCDLSGTRLTVEILETVPVDKINMQTVPGNLVAVKDCVICDIVTTNGYPLVEKGSEVKKGDILITGVIPIYNDYDELVETNLVAAVGTVYGIVSYEYSDEFPLQGHQKIYSDTKYSYALDIGGFSLHLPSKKRENCDTETEYRQLKIGASYYLPVTLRVSAHRTYETQSIVYTEEEAILKAKKKLTYHLEQMRKKGVEILENNVKIQIAEGRCIASGSLLCRELIGISVPIDNAVEGE